MQFSLSDISKLFNIPVSTLRYYEKEGALKFLQRDSNGYFLVDSADITSLTLLQLLREAGCSSKTITSIMKLSDDQKKLEISDDRRDNLYDEILQLLLKHSGELLEKQQRIVYNLQMTDFLRWQFTRYLKTNTSIIDDIPYPGSLPQSFTEITPKFLFEDLERDFKNKYAPENKNDK